MPDPPSDPPGPVSRVGTVARVGAVLLVVGFIALFVFHANNAGVLGSVGVMLLGAVTMAISLDRR